MHVPRHTQCMTVTSLRSLGKIDFNYANYHPGKEIIYRFVIDNKKPPKYILTQDKT